MQIISTSPVVSSQSGYSEPSNTVSEAGQSSEGGIAVPTTGEVVHIDPSMIKKMEPEGIDILERTLSESAWDKLSRTVLLKNEDGEYVHGEEAVKRFGDFASQLSKKEMDRLVSLTASALHGAETIDPRFGMLPGAVSISVDSLVDALEQMDGKTLSRTLERGEGFSTNHVLLNERQFKDSISRGGQELAARNFVVALTSTEDPAELLDSLEPWSSAQQLNLMELMVADPEAGLNLAVGLQKFDGEVAERALGFLNQQLEKRLAGLQSGTDSSKVATRNGQANSENWDDRFASTVDRTIRQMSEIVDGYEMTDKAFEGIVDGVISQQKPQDQRAALTLAVEALAVQSEHLSVGKMDDEPVDLRGEAALVHSVSTMLHSSNLVAAVTDATFSGNESTVEDLARLASVAVGSIGTEDGSGKVAEDRLDRFFGQVITLQDGVNRLDEDAEDIAWEGASGAATKDERTGALNNLAAELIGDSDDSGDARKQVLARIDRVASGEDIREVLDTEASEKAVITPPGKIAGEESPSETASAMDNLIKRYEKTEYRYGIPDHGKPESPVDAFYDDLRMAMSIPGTGGEEEERWLEEQADKAELADRKDMVLDSKQNRPFQIPIAGRSNGDVSVIPYSVHRGLMEYDHIRTMEDIHNSMFDSYYRQK